jgi:hydrogenase maturation protein HypF
MRFGKLILQMAETCSLGTIALIGGVFQNAFPSSRAKKILEARGYRVLIHRQVPTNDAGLALGQAAILTHQLG